MQLIVFNYYDLDNFLIIYRNPFLVKKPERELSAVPKVNKSNDRRSLVSVIDRWCKPKR